MTESSTSAQPLHECADPLIAIIRQLYDATLSPRFQVLITQAFIDSLVDSVIAAKCKNAKKITQHSRDFPYSVKLLMLNEMGLLSDGLYRTLNQLRKHRNDAAHDAFYELSGDVVESGGRKRRLHEFCIGVICEFYNQHQKVLAPLFAPTVGAAGGGVIEFPTKYQAQH